MTEFIRQIKDKPYTLEQLTTKMYAWQYHKKAAPPQVATL